MLQNMSVHSLITMHYSRRSGGNDLDDGIDGIMDFALTQMPSSGKNNILVGSE
jgi:hypothetical protein